MVYSVHTGPAERALVGDCLRFWRLVREQPGTPPPVGIDCAILGGAICTQRHTTWQRLMSTNAEEVPVEA